MTTREELEQEIAVHEHWARGRSVLENPLLAGAIDRAWQRVERLGAIGALAKARAELAALTALEQAGSACRDPENCGLSEYQCGCRFADCAQVPEPEKPRPLCEYGDHPLVVSEYDTCRRCGASAADRRAERRRRFDREVDVAEFRILDTDPASAEGKLLHGHVYADRETERAWLARHGKQHAIAGSRAAAVESLWAQMEAGRE